MDALKNWASLRATMIGDVVGSRRAADRSALHTRTATALRQAADGAIDAPAFTVGDEFQGSYPTVGAAIDAAMRVRLLLAPEVDVRFGIGWAAVTILDADAGIQDGPAWWAARDAIRHTADIQQRPGFALVRTTFRAPDDARSDVAAVNAALICRDHLLGSLDERSLRIVRGLMDGLTKKELAVAEGISASAVSQRASRDGLDLIVLAAQYLRSIT
ncbi:SatD family protein [Mycobacterium persicum]|uniref:SatD family protein n=1 Tax=Mycobacterium persicum TaxID=1487726 RepID=UPI0007BEA317|nr:SatD family protein [Mycobacterium persicum]KZS83497.1 RNA polymerase subunit sigma-70 [Mycobacterium persicum]